MDDFFRLKKKSGFWVFLVHPDTTLREVLDDFFRFSKKSGFGVFLVHLPMALVLLSASVERCFVYRIRDFLKTFLYDFFVLFLNL